MKADWKKQKCYTDPSIIRQEQEDDNGDFKVKT